MKPFTHASGLITGPAFDEGRVLQVWLAVGHVYEESLSCLPTNCRFYASE
jgi:hypothetical protein